MKKTAVFTQLFSITIAILFLFTCQNQEIRVSEWELVVENLQFPEGPAWDYQRSVFVSNCNSNWITQISDSQVDTFLLASDSTFGKTNGLTVGPDGDLYACDFGQGAIVRFSSKGEAEVFLSGYQGKRFNKPNDLVFTEDGNLYFSDPGKYDANSSHGRVFYLNTDSRQVKLVADSLFFPNGIAISPNNGKLYLSESIKDRVLRFDILESGEVTNREVFINLPGGDPDGLAFDVNGNLYVPHFGTGTLFVISPSGKILKRITTPGKNPSNVEFAGPDLKTLYLTEDETNAVYKAHINIAGQSLN